MYVGVQITALLDEKKDLDKSVMDKQDLAARTIYICTYLHMYIQLRYTIEINWLVLYTYVCTYAQLNMYIHRGYISYILSRCATAEIQC